EPKLARPGQDLRAERSSRSGLGGARYETNPNLRDLGKISERGLLAAARGTPYETNPNLRDLGKISGPEGRPAPPHAAPAPKRTQTCAAWARSPGHLACGPGQEPSPPCETKPVVIDNARSPTARRNEPDGKL